VFQEQTNSKDGKTEKRAVLIALADFQVREKASLLVYSAPPSRTYTHFSKLQDVEEQQRKMVQEGKVSQELVDEHNTAFGLAKSLFQARQCPEGFFGQTLMGMVKELPTTQDSLPLTERSTADWVRSREMVPSEDQTEQVTMMAFFMDGAIAFCPLTFSHMFLDDSAATSSLEFALRVFSNDIDMNKWQLREIKTVVGAEGRTYSEGKLWEDGGRCVASMTQQSIMRPKREKQKGKGKL
jgi:acyl-CoA thioesterase